MFFVHLMRYIRGYVDFLVQGEFVERFLNLAARHRVPIWDGHKRGDSFTGKTIAGQYKKLRVHAKKAGVLMRVTGKHGAPFTRRKYRRRTGLLIGAGIFIAFVFITSRFIWRVEVSGNELVSERQIISELEELGVTPGKLRSSINVRGVERRALLKLDGLSWLAVNIRGSAVYVVVREREPQPVMIDPDMPCNVVASRSGQIIELVAYSGQKLKAVGDTALEGDILVSGITEDRHGQNLFKHARAKVTARVQHQIIVDVPLEQTHYVETGIVKSRSFLHVFEWDIPLFWPSKIPQPYRVEREKSMLKAGVAELPVGILSEKYVLMREDPIVYTESEARIIALKELNAKQKLELEGAEVIDKTATGKLRDGVFTITADYVCIMDIAEEREILKSE